MAASVRIFCASSFAFSKFIVKPVLCPASIMIPLSRLPICPSSLSASGNMLAIPVLTVRSTPTAGASVETTSPSSLTVLSLSTICSSARRACMIIFSIFRTSASSLANTLALGMSCLLYASTMRTKIDLSRSVNLSPALSKRWIWSSILRIAKSKRGFNGPGGRTASFSLFCIGVLSSLSPHFLANLSDNFFPPKVGLGV